MNYHEMRTIPVHAYPHNLNTSLVIAFCKFAEEFIRTKQPVNVCNAQEFSGLDFNQRNNFQKLQYFGIVTRSKDGYILTKFGEEFFYGEEKCAQKVATLDNEVLSYSHPAWEGEKPVQWKYIYEYLNEQDFSWKKRPEYQEEASLQQRIF